MTRPPQPRPRRARGPNACFVAMALTLTASTALTAPRQRCDSCETCTAALATPGAEVEAQGPLSASGDTCVALRGAGASFDGRGHALTGAATGVSVEAPDALVRNVRVNGGRVGFHVTAPRATLYGVRTDGVSTGVLADGAEAIRIERAHLRGGEVGVGLGASTGETCPADATLRSPAAVVANSRVEGARVGLAACEARPVLLGNHLTGNGVGALLGAPRPAATAPAGPLAPAAGAPFDPCACAPELDDVRPGTTLFYSSGCGGCEIHEGWLPEVRGAGHDVRLRSTGDAHKHELPKFDAFFRRCAPAVIDALGVPGCVPNYACLANGAVYKRRGEGDRLERDANLESAAAVGDFAAACASAGTTHYGEGAQCVRHPLRGNTLCGNTGANLRAAAGAHAKGDGNTCGPDLDGVDGAALGCAAACPALAAPAPTPPPPAAAPPAAAPTAAAPTAAAPPAAPAPEPAPTPPTPQATDPVTTTEQDDRGGLPPLAIALGVLAILLSALGLRASRKKS